MISEELQIKINQSIKLLQTTCRNENELVELAYSGGKDSDVILQLAKEAKIKFIARYKNTTIDPPGTLQHVKDNGVEILQPKKTFFEIVRKTGFPNKKLRFCCSYLKEYPTEANTVILGIRKEESKKREKLYKEPVLCRTYSKKKKVKEILPILYWTEEDLLEFILDRNIKLHPLYYTQKGIDVKKRLGCMGCPLMSRKKRIAFFKKEPGWLKAWLKNGHEFYKDKEINEYDCMVAMLFYKSIKQFKYYNSGLFGKLDTKKILEEKFNVKLDDFVKEDTG